MGDSAMTTDQQPVTELLLAWRKGDEAALASLIPWVYAELKQVAAARLRRERQAHTLQTSDLVHSAFLRLIELNRIDWRDRSHFFSICSWIMRNVLVEHARRRARDKRGGGAIHLAFDELLDGEAPYGAEVRILDDALRDLGRHDAELARLVELRYFGGLTHDEIGEVLGLSLATVKRRWSHGRAWLRRYLSQQPAS